MEKINLKTATNKELNKLIAAISSDINYLKRHGVKILITQKLCHEKRYFAAIDKLQMEKYQIILELRNRRETSRDAGIVIILNRILNDE